MRIVRHLILGFIGSVLLLGASVAAVLAFPQPLFAYHAERGALQLWSDRPFDAVKADDVLADAERRIARAPLALSAGPHRIFVANAEWRRRLVFLWNYGAGGVNYYPMRNVFIRPSDVDGDRVLGNAGPVPPPRTLAYFAAHEVGHSLIGERIGALANHRLPRWIREGLADYIGFGAAVDIDVLTRALVADEAQMNPQRTGLYARYRLLVAYFLEREGWSVDRLLASNLPQDEAERRLIAASHR